MRENEKIAEVFGKLVSIDSPSLKEREMADYLKKLFGEIGVELEEDQTGEATGSNAGNLFARLEGEAGSEPLLLGVHMDTVEPSRNKKAVFHPDGTVTSNGTTVLGADDLAGVTAIYEAVLYLKEKNIPHRTVEILITTGEELYCKGANAFDYSKVRSKEAYALDLSGKIGAAAYAAPTLISFSASVKGKAAHAGFYPEKESTASRQQPKPSPDFPRAGLMKIQLPTSVFLQGEQEPTLYQKPARRKGRSAV